MDTTSLLARPLRFASCFHCAFEDSSVWNEILLPVIRLVRSVLFIRGLFCLLQREVVWPALTSTTLGTFMTRCSRRVDNPVLAGDYFSSGSIHCLWMNCCSANKLLNEPCYTGALPLTSTAIIQELNAFSHSTLFLE